MSRPRASRNNQRETPDSNRADRETPPATLEMSPNDRKFMDKLVELMEQNMDNGELVVDDLVRELHQDPTQADLDFLIFVQRNKTDPDLCKLPIKKT